MSPAARIVSFAVILGAVFLAAFGLGSAFESVDTEAGGHNESAGTHRETGGAHGESGGHSGAYALSLDRPRLEAGEAGRLRFRIEDAEGAAVKRFDELHERRMHLIVVRRDGTGFQHLHPEMEVDGTWTVPLQLASDGVYRAFADFSVGGEQHTLSGDLVAGDGAFEPRPFPEPVATAATSGYEVRLDARAPRADADSRLTFAVTRDGEEVTDLQPYLGAKGHLVALREGDLAYLHVHPEDGGHAHGGHAAAAHPNEIAFATAFPSPGRYRLYLQFRHEGAVRTAEFTVEVPR